MKWFPKQGEMINTPNRKREFIGVNNNGKYMCWDKEKHFAVLFTPLKCSEIKSEPITERRWQWAKDRKDSTVVSDVYLTDKYANVRSYAENGWYKLEDNYMDIEVKEKQNG